MRIDQSKESAITPRHTVNLWHGWGPILLLPSAVVLLAPDSWPRWLFMWTLAVAIFMGCKWLTWRRSPVEGAPVWKHIGYLLAWPGMDAAAFLTSSSRASLASPRPREWCFALTKLSIGALLFWGVARQLPPNLTLAIGWTGMAGIVMMLHFGVFHLLSCAWRTAGIDARPLMDWPLTSESVATFWGKRWNTAFRDLTHRFLFRPLASRLGATRAILASFLFSGLIHDLVISVPARGGMGGPTLFFLLQGFALLLSRSAFGKRLRLRGGLPGWSLMALSLLLTAPLLFQPVFLHAIIIPFMKAMGAIQ